MGPIMWMVCRPTVTTGPTNNYGDCCICVVLCCTVHLRVGTPGHLGPQSTEHETHRIWGDYVHGNILTLEWAWSAEWVTFFRGCRQTVKPFKYPPWMCLPTGHARSLNWLHLRETPRPFFNLNLGEGRTRNGIGCMIRSGAYISVTTVSGGNMY